MANAHEARRVVQKITDKAAHLEMLAAQESAWSDVVEVHFVSSNRKVLASLPIVDPKIRQLVDAMAKDRKKEIDSLTDELMKLDGVLK